MNDRPLGAEEQALWARVVATVRPLDPQRAKPIAAAPMPLPSPPSKKATKRAAPAAPVAPSAAAVRAPRPEARGLDGQWDRRIAKGTIAPDLTVDLHGQGLAGAYQRLDGALEQAVALEMRTMLLITGKARGHDRASGEGRGAIRAAVSDWLASSRHAGRIAAVRNAHPRHGGAGALYIVLRRER